MSEQIKSNAFYAGFAGLLMSYFGWGASYVSLSDSALYNAAFTAVFWMLKIGGPCMLIVAALCFTGRREGLLADAVVSGVCGFIMLVGGAIWILTGGLGTLNHLLFPIFGVMFLRSAMANWALYQHRSSSGYPLEVVGQAPPTPPVARPIHPASLKSDALPSEGEPPPEEGYLAALAKEKDEPPSASYE